ncbi:hypothetical protein AYI70_g4056 [Smittium culicis]|uniref:Uncharacterized protein n=1 Tax=Smittium culicis TaxID=133412 RepID=A0A1R1Y0R6_9FUNG|nr:hypothetical protein AYI70_g4056 [Smittium culicis]
MFPNCFPDNLINIIPKSEVSSINMLKKTLISNEDSIELISSKKKDLDYGYSNCWDSILKSYYLYSSQANNLSFNQQLFWKSRAKTLSNLIK